MEKQKNQLVIHDQLVNYYQFGYGKKTIIFLHGWRSNAEAWFGVITQLLNKDFKIYCLDLPGFGSSPVPYRPYSVGDYAAIVTGFMEKRCLLNSYLVGHSFGGRIAIKIASENPKLVDRLILVDSAGIKKEFTSRKKLAKIVKPIFKPEIMKKLRSRIYSAMGAEDYLATPELQGTYIKVIGEDLTDNLQSIKCKTLLIWGEDDKETPVADAEIINHGIERSRLEIIEDAGHFSFIDKPNEFVKIFKEFIE